MSVDICNDDRFELIAKARDALLERTNIEDSPEEMAVLDSILFRCWQMGWLDLLNVVKCRDCKLCDERYGRMLCRRDMSCDEIALDTEPDGFCAWGERKEEG